MIIIVMKINTCTIAHMKVPIDSNVTESQTAIMDTKPEGIFSLEQSEQKVVLDQRE